MKKLLIFLCSIFLCLNLCACKNAKINSNQIPINVPSSFNSNVNLVYQEIGAKCSVIHHETGITEIKVNSPEEIAGFEFKWLADQYEVAFNNLSLKTEEKIMPTHAPFLALMQALNLFFQQKNINYNNTAESAMCEFESENGKVKITINKNTGYLEELKIEDIDLTATFDMIPLAT